MEIVTNLFLFFCILLVCFLWSKRKLLLLGWKLPGPPGYPLVGNGLSFLCSPKAVLEVILNLSAPYSSPFRLWMGPKLVIFVKSPNQLQTIMQSSKMATKSFIYRFLEPFMGQGLFTANGSLHKNQRKLLQPFFGPKYLEGYCNLFEKHADKLVKQLEGLVDGPDFDILHHLHEAAFEATMDIMLEDKNEHFLDYKEIPYYVRRFYMIFSQRILSFWLHWDFIFRWTKYYKEQQDMMQKADKFTLEIMNSRVVEVLKRLNIIENDQDCTKETNRIPSMLEMMIRLVQEDPTCLDETLFKDHLLTFVATSQDTQSSAIAFTLMMIGMHKEVEEKVRKEMEAVLGSKETTTVDDYNQLDYLEMCLKEVMRLFPLGPFLLRDTQEDFQLEEWVLPKGCTVILGIYNVHRDPLYWEKPEEFFPEHFLPEAASKRHPFAFLPFSAGPRRCVAQHYSYLNMKVIVTKILQRYRIECDGSLKDLKLMTDVSIRPINGYLIRLKDFTADL